MLYAAGKFTRMLFYASRRFSQMLPLDGQDFSRFTCSYFACFIFVETYNKKTQKFTIMLVGAVYK